MRSDRPYGIARARGHLLATALALLACCAGRAAAADDEEAQAAVASLPSPIGAIEYTPGRGLLLGDTRFRLGGYTSLEVERDEGDAARASLADLSFFLSWNPVQRVHLFSELEIEDLVSVDTKGHGGTADNRFLVERLYADVTLRDALQVRLGRFLTPVGRWNVIHAQPLVWTTSRPLVTDLPFDNNTTGAMVFGFLDNGVSYGLFGQFVKDFESRPQFQSQTYSVGGRLEYDVEPDLLSLGSTYLSFRDRDRWHHLGGADLEWIQGPLEMLAELTVEGAEDLPGIQWGFYTQVAVATPLWVHLVVRYEYFDARGERPLQLVDLGLAYHPLPYLILKSEYLIADHSSPLAAAGFKASAALLF